MQKEFNTPTDKKRFEESQEDVNCCSSCPPTPKLDDRSVNNWQRLVTIEAVRESPMK